MPEWDPNFSAEPLSHDSGRYFDFGRLVHLPEPLAQLLAAGSTASFVVELGDRYDTYHEWIRQQIETAGGRPDPTVYTDARAYLSDFSLVQNLVRLEAVARACRQYRRAGGRFDPSYTGKTPLVSSKDELVYEP